MALVNPKDAYQILVSLGFDDRAAKVVEQRFDRFAKRLSANQRMQAAFPGLDEKDIDRVFNHARQVNAKFLKWQADQVAEMTRRAIMGSVGQRRPVTQDRVLQAAVGQGLLDQKQLRAARIELDRAGSSVKNMQRGLQRLGIPVSQARGLAFALKEASTETETLSARFKAVRTQLRMIGETGVRIAEIGFTIGALGGGVLGGMQRVGAGFQSRYAGYDSVANQFANQQGEFEDAQARLGRTAQQALLPVLTELTKLTEQLAEFGEKNPELFQNIAKAAGLLAAAGAVMVVTGRTIAVVGRLANIIHEFSGWAGKVVGGGGVAGGVMKAGVGIGALAAGGAIGIRFAEATNAGGIADRAKAAGVSVEDILGNDLKKIIGLFVSAIGLAVAGIETFGFSLGQAKDKIVYFIENIGAELPLLLERMRNSLVPGRGFLTDAEVKEKEIRDRVAEASSRVEMLKRGDTVGRQEAAKSVESNLLPTLKLIADTNGDVLGYLKERASDAGMSLEDFLLKLGISSVNKMTTSATAVPGGGSAMGPVDPRKSAEQLQAEILKALNEDSESFGKKFVDALVDPMMDARKGQIGAETAQAMKDLDAANEALRELNRAKSGGPAGRNYEKEFSDFVTATKEKYFGKNGEIAQILNALGIFDEQKLANDKTVKDSLDIFKPLGEALGKVGGVIKGAVDAVKNTKSLSELPEALAAFGRFREQEIQAQRDYNNRLTDANREFQIEAERRKRDFDEEMLKMDVDQRRKVRDMTQEHLFDLSQAQIDFYQKEVDIQKKADFERLQRMRDTELRLRELAAARDVAGFVEELKRRKHEEAQKQRELDYDKQERKRQFDLERAEKERQFQFNMAQEKLRYDEQVADRKRQFEIEKRERVLQYNEQLRQMQIEYDRQRQERLRQFALEISDISRSYNDLNQMRNEFLQQQSKDFQTFYNNNLTLFKGMVTDFYKTVPTTGPGGTPMAVPNMPTPPKVGAPAPIPAAIPPSSYVPKSVTTTNVTSRYRYTYTVTPYAGGSDYIPYDQMAWLHRGERVMTAKENAAYSMTSNNQRSIVVNITGNAIGGAVSQSELQEFGLQIADVIREVR